MVRILQAAREPAAESSRPGRGHGRRSVPSHDQVAASPVVDAVMLARTGDNTHVGNRRTSAAAALIWPTIAARMFTY